MKIALLQFYSSSPAPDYHEMAITLRALGHQVWTATPERQGALVWHNGFSDTARQEGLHRMPGWLSRVPIARGLRRRLAHLAFVLRVRRYLLQSEFDIVQVNPHGYDGLLVAGLPGSVLRVLDVRQAGEVSGGSIRGAVRNWKVRTGLRLNVWLFFDHACFATEEAARRILGAGWSMRSTIHPVGQHPSFLDYTWKDAGSASERGPVRFVYVGSLSKVRNLEVLLAAAERLRRGVGEFRLDLIGPDESEGHYNALLQELRMGDMVRILAPVPYERVAATVAQYDVALAYAPRLPDWECQPTLKVLEYRALGMPIIATDNASNSGIVVNGRNGLLVPETVEGMHNAMRQFVEDTDFRIRSSSHARSMRQGRTWDQVAREYEARVYRCAATLKRKSLGSPAQIRLKKGL